jgi:hypothetical protein
VYRIRVNILSGRLAAHNAARGITVYARESRAYTIMDRYSGVHTTGPYSAQAFVTRYWTVANLRYTRLYYALFYGPLFRCAQAFVTC